MATIPGRASQLRHLAGSQLLDQRPELAIGVEALLHMGELLRPEVQGMLPTVHLDRQVGTGMPALGVGGAGTGGFPAPLAALDERAPHQGNEGQCAELVARSTTAVL